MKRISQLKRQILADLSPHFRDLGLEVASDGVYWSCSPDAMRIVQISFLNARLAAYFGTTTASFNLEFGGLYLPASSYKNRKDFPKVHYCQIRGHLLRGYQQRAPQEDLPEMEHERHDIWWVDASGDTLNRVTEDAARAVQKDLGIWMDRLVDYGYLYQYVEQRDETVPALYGFGRKGSPARADLLDIFDKFA